MGSPDRYTDRIHGNIGTKRANTVCYFQNTRIEGFKLFNNREIATVIWLTPFAIWLLTKSNVRQSIVSLFRAFLNWKILSSIAAMALYTTAVVGVLYAVGF